MMRSSLDDEDEFAVNPFRTGTASQQQQDDPFYSHPSQPSVPQGPPQWSQQPPPPSQAPQWSQQQGLQQNQHQHQQLPQQHPDPHSGMTGSFTPMVPPPPPPQIGSQQQRVQQELSGTMDRRHDEVPSTNVSWLYRCTSCFRIEGYQPYFDLDTAEFMQRLQAAVTIWWQPDVFRTAFLRDDKPDLYGPLWITMTLIFVLAAASNLAAWASFVPSTATSPTNDKVILTEFDYDIRHLLHASSVLWTFVWAYPSLLWLACTCLGMPQISWAMWICVYGYSIAIFVPASLLCIMPWTLLRFIVLGCASFMSCLLVLRNLSTPLLSQDAVNQAKASPILLSMMGAHFVFFLILKFRFFK